VIFLKDYQDKVVRELENFFSTAYTKKADIARALQSVPENLRSTLANVDWVEQTFNQMMKPYHDKCSNGLNAHYPRIVLKVPTGGGKTLLAVEAIRAYHNLFAKKRTGLVVWIVPTETIYSQTVEKLRDKSHHLRQLLDQCSGNRTVILEKGQRLTTHDIENNLVVLFVMIQSISRANNKEALKVFQDSGGYESFFPADNRYDLHSELLRQFPNLDFISALGTTAPLIKTSLGNAVRISRPFIIIDEIHKVFSDTARKTIDTLNPEMVLGLSATPKKEMNILIAITGLQLKDADMVKLDMHIFPPASKQKNDWQAMVREIKGHREKLEQKANTHQKKTGIYIRPIALIQVEQTGKDQRGKGRVHSLDIKEYLINLKVNLDEIAIKTSSQNDIEDVNLFSPDCPVRFIITKEALREGWDCSFAYILGVIPNVNSDTSITQLIGRILRQPNAKKTGVAELDESYVYYAKGDTRQMIERVSDGFRNEGLEDLVTKIQIQNNEQVNPIKTVRVKKEFGKKYSNAFYLPVWVMVDEKERKRRFSYDMDIKSALPLGEFLPSKEQIERIKESLSDENKEKTAYIFTLDEESKVKVVGESVDVLEDEHINIEYLTRRYAEIIQNPFLARRCAERHVDLLKKKIGTERVEEHFGHISAMLYEFLSEEKQKQEEKIFLSLLTKGKLVLAVSDDEELRFHIPQTDIITVGREPNTYEYYLFDDVELSSMNSLERKVGDTLDKQEKILWWFRNKVGKNWYSIQGWQQYRIRPDFIAAKKAEGGKLELLYILESKGEHLTGNADTVYKQKVMELMTSQTRKGNVQYQQSEMFKGIKVGEKAEFYIVEQSQEEEEIKKLFK
jgi:type III restriction enzyme